MTRLPVVKTYKLCIDGKFPRSESGRVRPVHSPDGQIAAYVSHASRKDLRDAVEAARKAQEGWQKATAYLRGQILYRMAEMLEGKRREFVDALQLGDASARTDVKTSDAEVSASIDRLISFAGWADKYAQVLGCNNAVASPHYNFTAPEPTGVVVAIAPDAPSLLGLVSLFAPAIAVGNAVIAVGSTANPVPALVLGEVIATSDLPAGVLNMLCSAPGELNKTIAEHRDIDAIIAANASESDAALLRGGAAENLKRVTIRTVRDWFDADECENPSWLESVVEMKTVWHPSGV
jgi:acyl-CoA reductase-like NAD-dependent aldehyde dehydrogenase